MTMQGYYGKPEETAQALDRDGWMHSGDMGLLRSDGHLRFMGRHKDMLKIGGENVDPMEVEAFLMSLAGINQAAVVSFPDARLSEVGVAFVRREPGHALTETEVLTQCQGRIASFKIPRHVTDEIPRRVSIPVAGFHDLLGRPVGGGVSGHPNLQDLPRLVVHDEEDI